jgi:hypothetical protein
MPAGFCGGYGARTTAPIATIGGVIVLLGMAVARGSLRTVPLLTGLERIASFSVEPWEEREFCCWVAGG